MKYFNTLPFLTGTDSKGNSILLKNLLIGKGYNVSTFDPHINKTLTWLCSSNYVYFIGCRHDCFSEYEFNDECIVIDPHRYIKKEKCKNIIFIYYSYTIHILFIYYSYTIHILFIIQKILSNLI